MVREAQPLADCDMRRPPVGKEFYTGWSASTTLEKKGLIETWSNPKKVRLTESGRNLALAIKANQVGLLSNDFFSFFTNISDVVMDAGTKRSQ